MPQTTDSYIVIARAIISTCGRLVKEEHARLSDELRSNADSAALPARKPADKCIADQAVRHLQYRRKVCEDIIKQNAHTRGSL